MRSRIYCSYETVSIAAEKRVLPPLSTRDMIILDAIARQNEAVQAANTRMHNWQKRNNWRVEGLLRFVGLSLPLERNVKHDPLPACRTMFQLPSYCYDVHTRIGLTVQGVHGAEAIRNFFRNSTNAAHKALGEVLFAEYFLQSNCTSFKLCRKRRRPERGPRSCALGVQCWVDSVWEQP
jgi:hypothetical protein